MLAVQDMHSPSTSTREIEVRNNDKIMFLGMFDAKVEVKKDEVVIRYKETKNAKVIKKDLGIKLSNPLRLPFGERTIIMLDEFTRLVIEAQKGTSPNTAKIKITGPKELLDPTPVEKPDKIVPSPPPKQENQDPPDTKEVWGLIVY